ncbi:glycosyltransferase [Candidatus Dojkabacteria bacterium]|nr:glycosyltransferase [Candidatus Dojkabacteria bacterium]
MKVAIVHDFAWKMRGGERVVETFCKMYPKADLYMLCGDKSSLSPEIRMHKITFSWLNGLPFIRKFYRYTYPLWPSAIESFDLNAYDLVISSSSVAAKGVLTNPDTLHVCYMHAAMRYAWDQTWTYFNPNNFAKWKLPIISYFLKNLRIWDVAAQARVDRLVANSNFTAARVRKYYKRKPDAVIFPPVKIPKLIPPSHEDRKGEKYYVAISPFEPNKGGRLIIEFARLTGAHVKLLGDGSLKKELERDCRDCENIEFCGWVNENEKIKVLAGATALIFAGVEDFGIAPVEAMACGTPVVAYKKGGALDTVIAEEGKTRTGTFFDVQSALSLAKAVEDLQKIWENGDIEPALIRDWTLSFDEGRFVKEISEFIENSH